MTYQKAPFYLGGFFISLFLTVILGVIYNLSAGYAIDSAVAQITEGQDLSKIVLPLGAFLGLLLLTKVVEMLYGYFELIYNNLIDYIMDGFKFGKQMELDPQTYIDKDYTAKKTIMDWNGWKITGATSTAIRTVCSFIPAILYLIILFKYDWVIGLLTFISSIPAIYGNIKYGRRVWAIWDDNSQQKVIWGLYRNTLGMNPKPIKDMGYGAYLIEKLQSLHKSFIERINSNEKSRLVAMLALSLVEFGFIAGAYYTLFAGIITEKFTVGAMYVIIASLWGVKRELDNLFQHLASLESNAQFVDAFIEFMNLKAKVINPEDGVKIDRNSPIKIEFRNVWFKYPNTQKWIFKGLSLNVTKDEDIAIVGPNGAGKTTLVKLITRMYDPNKGEILINDIPLKKIDLPSYLQTIGLLDQNFNVYEFPAKENIIIGDVNKPVKKKNVEQAAKMAESHELIKELKHGYDTFLTNNIEGGQYLSGGQNQRLAIARVFYREPELLILDEPTSAIDAIAEEQIFNNIFNYSQNRTVIIISHRFATVKKAQRIVVIENGEIVEDGTHSKLINADGLYSKMYKVQEGE